MAPETITDYARRVSQWSAVALGASIPVSTALDNVLIAIMLAAWALSGQISNTMQLAAKNRFTLTAVALFLLLAIGTAYGDASKREALSSLAKYADLLYIPILMIIFRAHETRHRALLALAFSLAAIVLLSYLIRFDWLPKLPFITGNIASPTVFKLKLTHNLLLAFGAFLFMWLGYTTATKRARIFWYGFALLAMLNVVLMVQGATGYLVLIGLAILLGAQYFDKREAVAVLLALTAVLSVGISTPSSFQDRVVAIKRELLDWRPADNATTSTGLRLEFYQNSLAIVVRHPIVGVGTGGFPAAYAQQIHGTGKVETRNPHNEFLHMATQVGMLGVVLLITLFVTQWRLALFLNSPMDRSLARGLVLTMVIGCLLNSLLLDHTEGLLYAWLTGVLYGGLSYGSQDNSAALR